MPLRKWIIGNFFGLVPIVSLAVFLLFFDFNGKDLLTFSLYVWLPYTVFSVFMFFLLHHKAVAFLLKFGLAVPFLYILFFAVCSSLVQGLAAWPFSASDLLLSLVINLTTYSFWGLPIALTVALIFYLMTGIGWKLGWLKAE